MPRNRGQLRRCHSDAGSAHLGVVIETKDIAKKDDGSVLRVCARGRERDVSVDSRDGLHRANGGAIVEATWRGEEDERGTTAAGPKAQPDLWCSFRRRDIIVSGPFARRRGSIAKALTQSKSWQRVT